MRHFQLGQWGARAPTGATLVRKVAERASAFRFWTAGSRGLRQLQVRPRARAGTPREATHQAKMLPSRVTVGNQEKACQLKKPGATSSQHGATGIPYRLAKLDWDYPRRVEVPTQVQNPRAFARARNCQPELRKPQHEAAYPTYGVESSHFEFHFTSHFTSHFKSHFTSHFTSHSHLTLHLTSAVKIVGRDTSLFTQG